MPRSSPLWLTDLDCSSHTGCCFYPPILKNRALVNTLSNETTYKHNKICLGQSALFTLLLDKHQQECQFCSKTKLATFLAAPLHVGGRTKNGGNGCSWDIRGRRYSRNAYLASFILTEVKEVTLLWTCKAGHSTFIAIGQRGTIGDPKAPCFSHFVGRWFHPPHFS